MRRETPSTPRSSRLGRGIRVAGTVAAALLIAACGRGTPAPVAVPLPDLTDAEAPVIQRIMETREKLVKAPDVLEAWTQYAKILHAYELIPEAAACYREAMRRDPDDWRWPYLLGTALAADEPSEALAAFERALALNPPQAAVEYRVGDALRAFDRLAEARRAYERVLEREPRFRKAMIELASLDIRDGRLHEAQTRLEEAVAIEFRDRSVHARLAELYQRLGDADRAAREALLMRAHPEPVGIDDPILGEVLSLTMTSNAMWRRGVSAMARRQFDVAERAFRLVLEIRGESGQDLLNLAGALVRQQRAADGMVIASRALALDPDNAEVRSSYAGLLLELDRVDEALDEARTALRLDPRSAGGFYHLGVGLRRTGRAAEAMDALARAIELDPVHALAHQELAVLLTEAGRAAEAVPHWRDAAEFGPPNPEARLGLAGGLVATAGFGAAREALQAGLRESPDEPSLLAALATLLATCPEARHRDGAEALRLARTLVTLRGRNHVPSVALLAAAMAETGSFTDAVSTIDQAIAFARATNKLDDVPRLEAQRELYRSGKPLHQQVAPREAR
jgi:tetratricopeptide (TPR) repeat protein